jgi:hypothetical protein
VGSDHHAGSGAALRPGVLRAAFAPTALTIERVTVAAAAIVALGVVGYELVRHPGHLQLAAPALRLAMLALAAGAAVAIDDQAGSTVAASPVSFARRRGLRIGIAVAGWAAAWAVVVGLLAGSDATVPLGVLTWEAVAWLALGVTVAVCFGSVASAPALLAGLVLVHHLPDRLSLLARSDRWSAVQARWTVVLVTCVVVIAWSCRDPARRRRSAAAAGITRP